jgi:hypothetical protein
MYKFNVKDRNYTTWEIIPFSKEENKFSHSDIDKYKFFNEDLFSLDPSFQLLKSPIRERPFIAGVLVLQGNKTYGRKTHSTSLKPDKLLYKCVPNDPFLPSFLIPYEIKHMGFSKLFTNLYVTFKYDHWEGKHPYGVLLQVVGQVDDLPAFYEYQLYCKNLHTSINKFEKNTTKSIQKITEQNKDLFDLIREKYSVEDRTTNKNVFTVDHEWPGRQQRQLRQRGPTHGRKQRVQLLRCRGS